MDFGSWCPSHTLLLVITMLTLDGSVLPGSCATANLSLTIAALAERNIETILAEDFVSTG